MSEEIIVSRQVRIPLALYEWATRRAQNNRRSINKELQVILEDAQAADAQVALPRTEPAYARAE